MSGAVELESRSGQPTTATVQCAGFAFTGASVSAHTTFLFCRALDVILDIGSVVEEMLPIAHVLVTHGHQDHLLGLTRYAGLRRLQRMHPPKVLLPAFIFEGVRALFDVWHQLEGYAQKRPPDAELVPVEPGQEVPLKGRLIARAFPVAHTLPSVGYTLIERTPKLKPEFHGRSAQELVELKARGVAITHPVDRYLVSYIGDTLPETLERVPELGQSRVVIVECTFLLPEHLPLAEARGHLHLQHIVERLECFGDAQIILTHFSRRYRRREIETLVHATWPEREKGRLHLLV